MSEQFTKGKWVATEIGVCVRIESDDQSDGMLTPIARMEKYDFPKEHKANAALIACAPDMYEMLSELSGQLTEINAHSHVKRIERLLDKARGES